MDALFLVGRFPFGLLFVVSGSPGTTRATGGSRATRPPEDPFAGPAVS
jgi:hypothetical protein